MTGSDFPIELPQFPDSVKLIIKQNKLGIHILELEIINNSNLILEIIQYLNQYNIEPIYKLLPE